MTKIINFFKKYWKLLTITVSAIVALFIFKKRTDLIDYAKNVSKRQADDLKKIDDVIVEEREKNKIAEKEYEDKVDMINKEYEEQQKKLDENIKDEIDKIYAENKDDPDELAKQLSELTGVGVFYVEK